MLQTGARIDRFEIIGLLGAGGMGEVYRARDLRLQRDVALKRLPDALVSDAERRARFEREAQVLAAMNHPNIASLFEVLAVPEGHVLVLELVEGETLSDRLIHEAVPPLEALGIAAQVAAALEAAHEQGIIHRDLKPSNIRIRHDGTVKVLDFGLAKLFEPTPAPASRSTASDPTLTAQGQGGGMPRILGSPCCMSPEQARGLPVDKRTDVWAFGCVLFEMLSGARAFAGDSAPDVIARILEREPDLSSLPAGLPASLFRLLRRCLAKDRRQRLRDMGDARLEIGDALEQLETGMRRDDFPQPVASLAAGRAGWLWIAAAGLVSALLTAALALHPWRATRPLNAMVTRFSLGDVGFSTSGLAISPDGRQIAYVSDRGLVLRSLDAPEDRVLVPLNVVQSTPFFSPDGQWIGFKGFDALRIVGVGGGTARTLLDRVFPAGDWAGDHIYFGDSRGLFRVPASGGEPVLLAATAGVDQIVSVDVLPSGRALLYTVVPTRGNVVWNSMSIAGARIEALDLTTGDHHVVVDAGHQPRYLESGQLLYAREGSIYAVPFDAEGLMTHGAAARVLSVGGALEFDVSRDGTLVYRSAAELPPLRAVWVDWQGNETPINAPPMRYLYPRLSPDGQHIAFDANTPQGRDIFMWDVQRETLERFTQDKAGNPLATWSPDGRYLVFGSERSGVSNIYRQAADGTGEPELLRPSDTLQMPVSHSPAGDLLLSAGVAGHQRDIYLMRLDATRSITPLIATPANELWAEVSPDSRWLAYDSDESGQFEIYVSPFPDTQSGRRWQISPAGGRQPMWAPDGSALYYREFDGAMKRVAVKRGAEFRPGRPQTLFQKSGFAGSGSGGTARTYDISHDGRRFLMLKSEPQAEAQLIVVLNWFDELRRLAPLP